MLKIYHYTKTPKTIGSSIPITMCFKRITQPLRERS